MTEETALQQRIVRARLYQTFGSDETVETWMRTYRETFEGKTAEEMIEGGEYAKVLDEIGRIERGDY